MPGSSRQIFFFNIINPPQPDNIFKAFVAFADVFVIVALNCNFLQKKNFFANNSGLPG